MNNACTRKYLLVLVVACENTADAHFDEDSNLDIQKTIFNGLKREVIEELGNSVYETTKDQINSFQVEELIIDDKTDVEKVGSIWHY